MSSKKSDKRGRPRSFDPDKILDKALILFRQNGYLGTSYSDLYAATGLTKPSLYAAFGNKEDTFLAALDRYIATSIRPGEDILANEKDPREAVQKLLVAIVQGLTAKGTPPGCMIAANAACADAADVPDAIRTALSSAGKITPNAIRARLKSARTEQLPPYLNADQLADYFDMVVAGLSALAKQGAPASQLLSAVETAMSFWVSSTNT
ncbi:TetR/AcrR family transcriptional regulator [Labrenzia sp. PHM005]|uniref:TetR/AcrR family transcriptional regulator n=1 Tax=Labrenzia sp. PHM005 TaxID=2590016 RepID=UPI00143E0A20|nr:TetR/AcrR family transcriptional regulator [Labrenzia sp. PHM005]